MGCEGSQRMSQAAAYRDDALLRRIRETARVRRGTRSGLLVSVISLTR